MLDYEICLKCKSFDYTPLPVTWECRKKLVRYMTVDSEVPEWCPFHLEHKLKTFENFCGKSPQNPYK